jgi:hypothetical protein
MSHLSDPDRLERLAVYLCNEPMDTTPTEVADALEDAAARIRRNQEVLAALHALRPPCPTCGGKGEIGGAPDDEEWEYRYTWGNPEPCPDCSDGKVSWERLVNVFNALWDEGIFAATYHQDSGAFDAIHLLRNTR